MPRILDHPLRLHRVRLGVGQGQLAAAVGVHRSTVAAIEEARTVTPEPSTVAAIESHLRLSSGQLMLELQAWVLARRAEPPMLSPVARAVLAIPPEALVTVGSFEGWRRRITPSVAAFATMLGINRTVVAAYEHGIRENGMSDSLAHALVRTFELSDAYLLALAKLPPSAERDQYLDTPTSHWGL